MSVFYLNIARMSPFLQGEIGRRSGGDNVQEREGYAVAAGSALGLVALGLHIHELKSEFLKILQIVIQFFFFA